LKYLSIDKCDAYYGKLKVLDGVNLDVDKGDVVSLIGPSGSGKSTLLRVLVGLNKPEAGRVLLEGEAVDYKNKRLLKKARERFAIVFQQYNLFQNMTVLKNVTIAPVKIQGRPKKEVTAEAEELLKKVGLGEKLKSYPDELSGGQQQRVAIARSLALKPEILLLDEVTSALDPELVNEVLDTIRVLARENRTMIIVSHEMGFVREVSSKIAFMDAGQIIEIGDPQTILENPSSERAREFMSSILRN
jgi:polar amino acid transport system ATP-binding protein